MSSSHTIPPAAPVSLPDTMAGLVEAAIIDARLLDHNTYLPRGDHWHYSGNPPYCTICLAGSLIAGRLNFPPDSTASPCTFDAATKSKLNALSCIRLGMYLPAFRVIHKKAPTPHITELLHSLPKPFCSHFNGWVEFNFHLNSLERLLPSFRKIDDEAARL